MTVTEMHRNFKIRFDKTDSAGYPDFEPEEIDEWLNVAEQRFIKQRYGINNPKQESIEETQKRADDLRNVILQKVIIPAANVAENKPNGVFAVLPSAANEVYWFALNEEVSVVYRDCDSVAITSGNIQDGGYYLVTGNTIDYNSVTYQPGQFFVGVPAVTTFTGTGTVYSASTKRSEVKPTTHDEYNKIARDPFNKPRPDQVRRLMYKNQAELLTDGTFAIENYYLRYIRKPQQISLSLAQDSELADHTHQEIVAMAVELALENVESKRYQTTTREVTKEE